MIDFFSKLSHFRVTGWVTFTFPLFLIFIYSWSEKADNFSNLSKISNCLKTPPEGTHIAIRGKSRKPKITPRL